MPDQHGYMMPGIDPEEKLFQDIPMRDAPDGYDVAEAVQYLCPRCKGRGKWNLKLDQYQHQTVPEHKHFQMSCGSCWGYGYLQKGQTCAHEWRDANSPEVEKFTKTHTLYRCEHLWICKNCGDERVVDSSD